MTALKPVEGIFHKAKIYCDSSNKEACIVVGEREPAIISYPAPVTVNVGEYKAVILALELAIELGLDDVEILTDSLLVVNQVNGLWKCRKPHLLPFLNHVRLLADEVPFLELGHVPREYNLAGRVLEGK